MKGRETAHLKKVISSTVDEHGNELVGRCGVEGGGADRKLDSENKKTTECIRKNKKNGAESI